MIDEALIRLYKEYSGHEPEVVTSISGSGSSRRYYRLGGEPSVIGTIGTNFSENRAFLYFTDLFERNGLPVPQVLKVSDDGMRYLQSDLGNRSLFSVEADERWGLLEATMAMLPKFQFCRDVDYGQCYPVKEFDERAVKWDLNYFKYCFLKPVGVEFDENLLEDAFERFDVLGGSLKGLVIRDFQSRNVMVYEGRPYLIDYQSARRGTVLYDVASMLWQARLGLSDDARKALAEVYFKEVPGCSWEELRRIALFRTIQVLGAYGFRGLIEGKAHFLQSIAPAIANLRSFEDIFPDDELGRVLRSVQDARFAQAVEDGDRLTIKVYSFGYCKSGIQRDLTGNGGGFVFDCRAMTNPGRFDEYKSLTGLDEPVKEFLIGKGEVEKFLKDVESLVDNAVERYLQRGFTSLSVAFGCTGGQHRSVFCAESMGRHLSEKYGVKVEVEHVEQGIKYTREAK